jgi:hypothetical protein
MNRNDMDRYYWRTGHRWSGDPLLTQELLHHRWFRLRGRTLVVLFVAAIVTWVMLFLLK